MSEPKLTTLSNAELEAEISRLENAWDARIIAGDLEAAQEHFGARFQEANALLAKRRSESSVAVVRLRLLAGETSRRLDAACAEALGWRVSKDPWWNWHEGPVFDPPGDEWCIRRDGRNDLPCNEALPHFTAESFEQELGRAALSHMEPKA